MATRLPLLTLSMKINSMISVNYEAAMNCSRTALSALVEDESPSIVESASILISYLIQVCEE